MKGCMVLVESHLFVLEIGISQAPWQTLLIVSVLMNAVAVGGTLESGFGASRLLGYSVLKLGFQDSVGWGCKLSSKLFFCWRQGCKDHVMRWIEHSSEGRFLELDQGALLAVVLSKADSKGIHGVILLMDKILPDPVCLYPGKYGSVLSFGTYSPSLST